VITREPSRSATATVDRAWDDAGNLVERRPYLVVVFVFLVLRLGDLGMMEIVARRRQVSVGGMMRSWDSWWYVQAALHGWPSHMQRYSHGGMLQSTWAWGPMFPGLIRALATPFGLHSAPVVAVGINLVCGAAAAVVLTAALRPSLSTRGAAAVAMLWASMPASPVFLLGYAEGLFMLLCFGAMWAVLRHRYLLAGVLVVLGGLTKSSVLPFAVTVAICALFAARRDASPQLSRARAAATLALSALAVIVWPAITAISLGSLRATLDVQAAWGRRGFIGLDTWYWLYHFGQTSVHLGDGLALAVFIAMFVAGILLWRDRRFPLFVRVLGLITPVFNTLAVGGVSTIRLTLGDLAMPGLTWRITKGWRGVLLTSGVLLMLRYGWVATYVAFGADMAP